MAKKRRAAGKPPKRSVEPLRISVITPSFNSVDAIERAIKSVLLQDYPHFEHIIMDGGSTDGTVEILKKYEHLKWVSEPDEGQSDAMNKGFARATGDIIAYLNADDYYLEGAFAAIIPKFEQGAKMVMGKVRVIQKTNQTDWINDPRTDLESMLHHWERDAFCVNPVGYFYLREVQEQVPFNVENPDKMDLEFLLGAASYCKIEKLDHLMGVFEFDSECKTGKEQTKLDYWRPDNFPEVNAVLGKMPEEFQESFAVKRSIGYQRRRGYQIAQIEAEGRLGEYLARGELIPLPQDEEDVESDAVAETERYACEGDSIICVLTYGKVASQSVAKSLNSIPAEKCNVPVYHLHTLSPEGVRDSMKSGPTLPSHAASGAALMHLFDNYRPKLNWLFVAGVREPVSYGISEFFQNKFSPSAQMPDREEIMTNIRFSTNWAHTHFHREYADHIGVNCLGGAFDKKNGYKVYRNGNISVLVYKLEDLSKCFSTAIQEFIGVQGVDLLRVNATETRDSGALYKDLVQSVRFPVVFLDEIYDLPVFREFYSASQIRVFKKRWTLQDGQPDSQPVAETAPAESRTIYDVGLHKGEDTCFYLAKGFRVVAVEANPVLCDAARERFADAIARGQLVLINVAIAEERGELTFFVNRKHTEWSSVHRTIADRDTDECLEVSVPGMSLAEVIELHGEPYYIKIDIEGNDTIAIQSLLGTNIRPRYISVENGNGQVSLLEQLGYHSFQHVQQRGMTERKLPYPAREGRYVEFEFETGASGPFGAELDGPWVDGRAIREELAKIWDPDTGQRLPGKEDQVVGWFDLHARWEQ